MKTTATAWPRIALLLFLAFNALFWVLQPIFSGSNIPLDTAELTVRGREWAWGYHNHGPLASVLADLIHRAAGPTHAAVALAIACQLLTVSTFYLVWRLARSILPPRDAFLSVALLGTTGYYGWLTREFNHNLVMLPLVAMTVLACHQALQKRQLGYWFLVGTSLGLGVLCKYSMGLLGIVIALFILCYRPARPVLRTAGPYLAAIVALVVISPHIVWLMGHDFPTVAYIARRSPASGSHVLQPAAFVAGQLAYLGLFLVALPFVVTLPLRKRSLLDNERATRDFLLAITIGPPALLLVYALTTGRALVTAWAMPFWIFSGVLVLLSFKPAPAFRRALTACILLLALNFTAAPAADLLWPCVQGRPRRVHFPGRALAHKVEAEWQRRFHTPLPAVAGDRWLADNVAFYAGSRPRALTYDLNLNAYPEQTRREFFRQGGVLIWDAAAVVPGVPDFLRREYPSTDAYETVELEWETVCKLPPARIGMTMMAPAGDN